jgi:hypothetical protein
MDNVMPGAIEIKLLRDLSEDDVLAALDGSYLSLPITDAASALELVNVLIDHVSGERDLADAMDHARVGRA